MQTSRTGLLPFGELDDQQFEAFVLAFLGAGISLEVIELSPKGSEDTPKAARYRIVGATLFGGPGRGGQRGIDIKATTETGATWAFQCKHYTSPFSVSDAQKAIAKARKEFPEAARYFLILSGEPAPDVREEVEKNERWEIWGGSELSIRFLNEVDRAKQIDILQRLFPNKASDLILRLYPLRDDPLILGSRFFEIWNRPGRVFHHRAKLVGRAEELKQLHALINDPSTQAIILPATGGVGKTRILRALDETFALENPGRHLYFIDVNARPEMGSTILRTSRDGELVLVQDDAHRAESLRSDLVASLVEKRGKLILATRPHAVDDLKAWLVRLGIDSGAIQVMPQLVALKRQELVDLALELLPENAKHWAETLAGLAKGNTLVVTVAAELIAQGKFDPAKSFASETFQREVFDRFEAESFAQAVDEADTSLARDILRILAVLAPWNEQVLPLDKVLAVLGDCSPRKFQEIFDQLREARLLVQTRQGWRVVPDLFADHLVYRGCYTSSGKLTAFARRLQDALATATTSTVLRNLAEAEWQARLENPQCASLISPFWERLKEDFLKADYYGRTQILRTWAKLSAMQPERTVELARLALELKTAPLRPEGLPYSVMSAGIWSRGAMLDALPGLLEPIAIYHADFRRAALDLLWEAHLENKVADEKASDTPLAAIGRAGQFRMRLPVSVSQEVVDWLESKLKSMDAAEFCDQPSPSLAVILKPAFEPEIEDNYSDGNVFTVRTFPVAVEATRNVRVGVLRILKDLVIPRGEIATLNALSVLDAAIGFPRLHFGGDPNVEFQKSWTRERSNALALVAGLVTANQSPRVLYRIRRMLRPLAHRDHDLGFRTECIRILQTIPDTTDLRIARVLLSSSWSEFFHDTPHEKEDVSQAKERVESEWLSLVDSVGTDIVERHKDSGALLEYLDYLVADYTRVGLSPQCWQLLSGIARADGRLAAETIDLLLGTASTQIDAWWTALFGGQIRFPDPRLIGWATNVLRSDNRQRQRALLAILGWVGVGEIPSDVLQEVATWAHGLNEESLEIALENIRWRDMRKAAIDDAILNNLNLENLSADGLAKVATALSNVLDLRQFPLSSEFVRRFIRELVRVEQLDDHQNRGFILELARIEPRLFFDMLVRRIQNLETRKASGQKGIDPLPIGGSFPLTELPQLNDYPSLAEDLFERFRRASDGSRYWWQMLFRDAVLRVSPVGLDLMKKWLPKVQNAEELEEFIRTLQFEGSMVIFREPEFTNAILLRIRQIAPTEFERMRWYLGHTASPRIRSYVGHQLEPKYQYYRDEAAKAAAVHEKDPELATFYREILRGEDADAARHREQAELDAVEWQYS